MLIDKGQLQRAREFSQDLITSGVNDEWHDFENLDLHLFFDEVGEYESENGVWAYSVEVDKNGYRTTNTSCGVKILNSDLGVVEEVF